MDLIFGLSIEFWGKVSVGDRKFGLKFWPEVKISGVLFVGGKFRHSLKIFVTFSDIFSPIRYIPRSLVNKWEIVK